MCVCVCVRVFVCVCARTRVCVHVSVYRKRERPEDDVGVPTAGVIGHLLWMLGTKFGSSGELNALLTSELSCYLIRNSLANTKLLKTSRLCLK